MRARRTNCPQNPSVASAARRGRRANIEGLFSCRSLTMLSHTMLDIPFPLPVPPNEPILSYAPGSPERAELKSKLAELAGACPDVPHVIGGQALHTGAAFD